MTNHPQRSAKLNTVYLWRAWQSEPGMSGAAYAATYTQEAPAPLSPGVAYPGLVYQETLYDDWKLVGTTKGLLVENTYGDVCVENRSGIQRAVESIVRFERFKAA